MVLDYSAGVKTGASTVINRVLEEVKDYGCGAVHITASDMGVKLYTAHGFMHNEKGIRAGGP